MKQYELYAWIDSLTQDINFRYHGKDGSICPFSRDNISLCFDGKDVTVHSVSDAMSASFIDGNSLNDLCGVLDFD